MIMWIPQLISCGIHMKSEIPVDQAGAWVRAPRASLRTAPTVTMHPKVNGIGGHSEVRRPSRGHCQEITRRVAATWSSAGFAGGQQRRDGSGVGE